jgi:Adenylosuccinate synthetase/Integrase core domain
MSVIAVIGAQWGDEGKGKIVDLLSEQARVVVRYQGGTNAGHTIVNDLGTFRMRLIPSGIFNPKAVCVIGNGVVVDPGALLAEMDELEGRGVSCARLFISERAHVLMPYHVLLDQLEEQQRSAGGVGVGTTKRGWLFLVAAIDWYSRYVISWQLDQTLAMPFVLQTVQQALHQARPEIWNSDQGSHFTSQSYRQLLAEAKVQMRMDGRGRAVDNVFTERLWWSIKYEEVYLNDYQSPAEARRRLAE